jgi:hypothetical protein
MPESSSSSSVARLTRRAPRTAWRPGDEPLVPPLPPSTEGPPAVVAAEETPPEECEAPEAPVSAFSSCGDGPR